MTPKLWLETRWYRIPILVALFSVTVVHFIPLIPIVGAIWLLVLFCSNGTAGPNKYGKDPKAE